MPFRLPIESYSMPKHAPVTTKIHSEAGLSLISTNDGSICAKNTKLPCHPVLGRQGAGITNCSVLLSSADLCTHLSPYHPSSESVPTLLVSRRHIHPGDNRNHRRRRGLSSELLVASCARRLETRPEAVRAAVSHRGDCRGTGDLSLLATP